MVNSESSSVEVDEPASEEGCAVSDGGEEVEARRGLGL